MTYQIKKANKNDIKTIIQWASQEGWNPGLNDGNNYYSIDSNGFLVGKLNNELIASISCVKYGHQFGFIGFYIVKPSFRQQGFGIQIWQRAMDYLQSVNIGLDGVLEQQHNYEKSGFKLAFNNARYQGLCGNFPKPTSKNIQTIDDNLIPKIIEYDKPFFADNRQAFINTWLKQNNSYSLAFIDKQNICGYACARQCENGIKIAPLFANSIEIANQLLINLVAQFSKNTAVFLDIPEINDNAYHLVKQYNMEKVFATVRMYNKQIPNINIQKTYGITSFEVG